MAQHDELPPAKMSDEVRAMLRGTIEDGVGFKPVDLSKVENFTSFFAEWTEKDGTLLVHLFPRAGADDKWSEGHYILRCVNCKAEVPEDIGRNRKPCPRCGKVGLVFVPGRTEEKARIRFPGDVLARTKRAADAAWMGEIAIDQVPELAAVVVQFKSPPDSAEAQIELMDQFFTAFDQELDKE